MISFPTSLQPAQENLLCLPEGPLVLVGQVILGFPTQKETNKWDTVINFLCEKTNLCYSLRCLGKKNAGGSERKQKLRTKPSASPRARCSLSQQAQTWLNSASLKTKTRQRNGNDVQRTARLLLCCLTLVHLLRHYKGNFANNTRQEKKRQREEELTVRPGSPGSPASPFMPWRPWSKQRENRSQVFYRN